MTLEHRVDVLASQMNGLAKRIERIEAKLGIEPAPPSPPPQPTPPPPTPDKAS